MDIANISDFRKAYRHGPYAWPGGYPCYFITADGAALSFKAAKAERRNILEALSTDDKLSGWYVVAMDINYADEILPELKAKLVARLPQLLTDFKAAMLSVGFKWEA